jgi:hypothetical protein
MPGVAPSPFGSRKDRLGSGATDPPAALMAPLLATGLSIPTYPSKATPTPKILVANELVSKDRSQACRRSPKKFKPSAMVVSNSTTSPGHRKAVAGVDLHAEPLHVGIFQQVGPLGAVAGRPSTSSLVHAGQDAVLLRAQGEGGAVGGGVVEAQPSLEHVQSDFHFREHAGETGIAEIAAGELGIAVFHHAERAGVDDAGDEVATLGGVQEPGVVVVGIRGEVGVPGRKIEERLVPLELLVAEDPERGVAGAETLDDGGGALAEDFAFLLNSGRLPPLERVLPLGVIEDAQLFVDDLESCLGPP